ncbi:hypothetical protein [Octadecabacter sp. R77987]|uniref:hypothetical protein n=1 Tax=Octadecabacter sp. R77987 TaxID=3093874 RepID=UPI00366FCB2E
MDLLVLAGIPLIALNWRRLCLRLGTIVMTFVASVCLSFFVAGGEMLVFMHALALALPFMLLIGIAMRLPDARKSFLQGFLIGAGCSVALFFAQLVVGAETLDFRTNTAFSLPPQYRRGFAFFPEVSTFATHSIIALAVCLCLLLHPRTNPRHRRVLMALSASLTVALLLSRSTSFLVVAPLLCALAAGQARKLDSRTLLWLVLITGLAAVLLTVFFNAFYAERLETAAASRSAAMRLASVLGGLSTLWRGEVFGVGLGENHEILRRAYDIGRALDLRFGQLPQGVNSQVIARIFEEGWPAVVNFAIATALLLRVALTRTSDPVIAALTVIAAGSFLTALLVTGYRGVYTNWLWLAVPAAVLTAQHPVRRNTTPNVRPRIPKSISKDALRT